MNKKLNTVVFLLMLLTALFPVIVSANDGKICSKGFLAVKAGPSMPIPDTIPSPMKPVPEGSKPSTEQPVTAVIKHVPKARKVALPRPVTVKVKPVKVVKPRLTKPVLKVL